MRCPSSWCCPSSQARASILDGLKKVSKHSFGGQRRQWRRERTANAILDDAEPPSALLVAFDADPSGAIVEKAWRLRLSTTLVSRIRLWLAGRWECRGRRS